MIMELVSGGNLFDRIKGMYNFTEAEAASIVKQLCLALNYMHNLNIMHRDIKPENLLCEQNDNGDIVIKLTDFGFATHFNEDSKHTLSLGSPLYMAPELCNGTKYDSKVDVWSVGVIVYVLLAGTWPFCGQKKDEIYRKINQDPVDYSKLLIASDSVKDFIAACMQKDPESRPTID